LKTVYEAGVLEGNGSVFKSFGYVQSPIYTMPTYHKSVLLIGASGVLGKPLVEEFIRQKSKFEKIGILSDPTKLPKFDDVKRKGVEIISGSYLDPNSYRGIPCSKRELPGKNMLT
jgi:hypothetical protein